MIARAKTEKDGGSQQDQELFRRADSFYLQLMSDSCDAAHADASWWKGYLGRAELYLDRVTLLEDEVRGLVSGKVGSQRPRGRANWPSNHLQAAQSPLDLKMLDALLAQLQSPQSNGAVTNRTRAASVVLVAAIQSLQTAIDCFDGAVRRNPGLVEAYRDRGLAYLVLAQSEGALAAMEDADPGLETWLAGYYPQPGAVPSGLDRAIAYAQNRLRRRHCKAA